ncbi:YbaB/EbfC family nucleoid-associated protein [Nocardia sp. NBC_01730]|uniref:YbaB/EbfC family nucleoid-associated protein n=1 Tax=Nocardia sp. NBC_01730 TaxID=2975998 RepID=UPI002E1039B7|nr:YbaB/EbfC family nucleoid-associated protein [Nocardia sp. NBC_01730]WSG59498.1 YbaB/EbfC family nucleoid-associated protein [Nocardia sp. NBC_01730]WSG61389.1 YbaB/EbfC family nucleoid-associated protein [Nocardia sp. NBC_01730]WSG61965.1 YbaB/EbfC family nucleoid-associated protein [Nocardia sp. NBC_01730]
MADDFADASFAEAMDSFTQQMQLISGLQQQRARLTASASVRDRRVTVTVNADGVVIETKFSSDIDDLDYDEIAAAMTQAAQQAAAEIARRTDELLAPLTEQKMTMPKFSDLVEGFPDVQGQIPAAPVVSLAPPNAVERQEVADDEPGRVRPSDRSSGVYDSSW